MQNKGNLHTFLQLLGLYMYVYLEYLFYSSTALAVPCTYSRYNYNGGLHLLRMVLSWWVCASLSRNPKIIFALLYLLTHCKRETTQQSAPNNQEPRHVQPKLAGYAHIVQTSHALPPQLSHTQLVVVSDLPLSSLHIAHLRLQIYTKERQERRESKRERERERDEQFHIR